MQVKVLGQFGEVVRVVVHVVAVADLCGAAVTAPVMGDDSITVMQKEDHLGIPVVGAQRPAMTENDGLTCAPVFVEDLSSVTGRELGHSCSHSSAWTLGCADERTASCERYSRTRGGRMYRGRFRRVAAAVRRPGRAPNTIGLPRIAHAQVGTALVTVWTDIIALLCSRQTDTYVMRWEMIRNISVDGQVIRTSVRAGDPARPPLVMANGIGASLELLQPFVDEIDPDIGVIRFDVPGVGGSPLPSRPYRFGGLVRLLDLVLDQLGYDRIDMLGVSWGGALAQQFALRKPRRCRRLVLASTATGSLMIPAGPRILKNMATPRRYRDPGYAVQIAANVYGGRLREDPELARELLHKHLRLGPSRGYAYQLLAGLGWTSLPFLPLIRQQTLILAGADDPIIPLINARIMCRLLPHADVLIYDDGHLGLLTCAPELGKAVTNFLRAS